MICGPACWIWLVFWVLRQTQRIYTYIDKYCFNEKLKNITKVQTLIVSEEFTWCSLIMTILLARYTYYSVNTKAFLCNIVHFITTSKRTKAVHLLIYTCNNRKSKYSYLKYISTSHPNVFLHLARWCWHVSLISTKMFIKQLQSPMSSNQTGV